MASPKNQRRRNQKGIRTGLLCLLFPFNRLSDYRTYARFWRSVWKVVWYGKDLFDDLFDSMLWVVYLFSTSNRIYWFGHQVTLSIKEPSQAIEML
jgi:hypothetical protein